MLLRFREERKKRLRVKSAKRFSLEDGGAVGGGGEELALTHKGQARRTRAVFSPRPL